MIELNKVILPKSSYKFKVTKAERGTSQKGQPKADVDLELFDNPDINLTDPDDGSTHVQSPNGMSIRTWLSFQSQSLGSVNAFLKAVGLPTIKEPEMQTFDVKLLEGKTGIGIASGRYEPQVDAAKNVIVNPYTNKPSVMASNKFTEFFAKPSGAV